MQVPFIVLIQVLFRVKYVQNKVILFWKEGNFMNQEKIGKFIAEKRKERNLTQEQLAEKLGVTNRSISNWENGKNMPDLSLFKPLCNELNISINELMSGEIIDNKNYINVLEENIVDMVSDLEDKKKKRKKRIFIFFIIFILVVLLIRNLYMNYQIDVKYDKRVMQCSINNENIEFVIKGQSMLNTKHIIKEYNGQKIYFFHSTFHLYHKSRSNWEYYESMASLLDNKDFYFGYREILDINSDNIKVYYTDYSINEIKKANGKKLDNIIKKAYLMCSN